MSAFSDYAEAAICNWIRGNANMPAAVTPYLALFSSDPSDANSGTEVTVTIRAAGRVAITFGAPSNGVMTNSADVDFGNAAGGATVSHFGVYDAASSGNLLVHGALPASKTVNAGDPVKVATSGLTVTVA